MCWYVLSPRRLFLFFSGMFFDGNHTYMIEPGGQGGGDVSTADGFSQQRLSICPSSVFSHPAASTLCWVVWGQIICWSTAVFGLMSSHSPVSFSLSIPHYWKYFEVDTTLFIFKNALCDADLAKFALCHLSLAAEDTFLVFQALKDLLSRDFVLRGGSNKQESVTDQHTGHCSWTLSSARGYWDLRDLPDYKASRKQKSLQTIR